MTTEVNCRLWYPAVTVCPTAQMSLADEPAIALIDRSFPVGTGVAAWVQVLPFQFSAVATSDDPDASTPTAQVSVGENDWTCSSAVFATPLGSVIGCHALPFQWNASGAAVQVG